MREQRDNWGDDWGADLSPEAQLLLCCARTQLDAARAAQIVALSQKALDWCALLQLALRHDLAPLVARSLEAVCPAAVPKEIRTELRQQVRADAQRNLLLTKELIYLRTLFSRHDISVLPYKGPVLATSIYGDLVLRPFHDLDILVREEELLPAVDLLAACGYQIVRPPSVAQAVQNLQSLWAYQLILAHPDRQLLVELHWRIMPKYFFPASSEQLWEERKPVALASSTVLSLAPESLLWFLCVHGAKHHWRQLSRLCDIAELLCGYPQLDWEKIGAQAKRLGAERRLYLGLRLANLLLNAPLPKTIQAAVQTDATVNALARQVVASIFDDTEQIPESLSFARIAFELKTMERMMDRARYLQHLCIKPMRLANTYGQNLVRRERFAD